MVADKNRRFERLVCFGALQSVGWQPNRFISSSSFQGSTCRESSGYINSKVQFTWPSDRTTCVGLKDNVVVWSTGITAVRSWRYQREQRDVVRKARTGNTAGRDCRGKPLRERIERRALKPRTPSPVVKVMSLNGGHLGVVKLSP